MKTTTKVAVDLTMDQIQELEKIHGHAWKVFPTEGWFFMIAQVFPTEGVMEVRCFNSKAREAIMELTRRIPQTWIPEEERK